MTWRGILPRSRRRCPLPIRRSRRRSCQTVVDGAKRVEEALDALNTAHLANVEIADQQDRANDNAHHVIPLMDELRAAIDAMEIVVDDNHWPVPTYNEILFYC